MKILVANLKEQLEKQFKPVIKQHKTTHTIVLFSSPTEGVVLQSKDSWLIGRVASGLPRADDENIWEEHKEAVTLKI